MPERNRVTPMGEVVAIELRGGWMGNRGCLHNGHDVVRHHRGRRWIICALEYRDWRAPQWAPNRYTPLFFHDEAVALAAGHRPCALCRRSSYNAYRAAADAVLPADDLDLRLHDERWDDRTRSRRVHAMPWAELPTGTFVLLDEGTWPAVVRDHTVVPWSTKGYGPPVARPRAGSATVITPPTSVRALRAGYPVLH